MEDIDYLELFIKSAKALSEKTCSCSDDLAISLLEELFYRNFSEATNEERGSILSALTEVAEKRPSEKLRKFVEEVQNLYSED